MGSLDRDQLEALRKQVEEDYRLDMAAIERLQRRFLGSVSSVPSSVPANTAPAPSNMSSWNQAPISDTRGDGLPKYDSAPNPQGDEVTSSLRAMFSNSRK
jgi:hypothetical protein